MILARDAVRDAFGVELEPEIVLEGSLRERWGRSAPASGPRAMTSLTLRAASIAVLLVGALGCGPRLTAEEKVELLRSQYTASLESLTVKQDPMVAGAADGGDDGVADSAAPVVRTDAILDIVVSTDGEEQLPGLTLDIEHLDADRRAKDRSTFWVETAALARGAVGAGRRTCWRTSPGRPATPTRSRCAQPIPASRSGRATGSSRGKPGDGPGGGRSVASLTDGVLTCRWNYPRFGPAPASPVARRPYKRAAAAAGHGRRGELCVYGKTTLIHP